MAKFVNVDNLTYAGKEAEEIFVKSLYESDLKGYGIRYMPDVKGKQKLATGEVGALLQGFSCAFTPQGEVRLSEQTIEPIAVKVNLENCFDDFWGTFLVEQTEITLKGGIPQTFFDWFFGNVLIAEIKKEYEELFWNGSTGSYDENKPYLGLGDGILHKLANSNAVNVAGANLTTANILEKIGEVANAINEMDADVEGYKIFVNYMDYRKMVTALGANSPATTDVWANFAKEGQKVYAYGYEVVPTRIKKDAILGAHPMNLVLGYDVADAELQYKIIDMRETTLDNTFRVAVVANIAVGVIYPELCVYAKVD